MGTDIHVYYEKRFDDIAANWVTAEKWVEGHTQWEKYDYEDRNYSLFGAIAKVRREYEFSFDPKGFPEDTCKQVSDKFVEWGLDAHTPSWLTLDELREFSVKLLLEDGNNEILCILNGLQALMTKFDGMHGDDHRIVFWFDN